MRIFHQGCLYRLAAQDTVNLPSILYHGTTEKFTHFDVDKIGRRDSGNIGIGVYLSTDRDIAQSYAEENTKRFGGEPIVLEVRHNLRQVANFDEFMDQLEAEEGVSFPPKPIDPARSSFLTRWFTQRGYDAVIGGSHEVVVFDPSKLKIVGTKRILSHREQMIRMLKEHGKSDEEIDNVFGPGTAQKFLHRGCLYRQATVLTHRREEKEDLTQLGYVLQFAEDGNEHYGPHVWELKTPLQAVPDWVLDFALNREEAQKWIETEGFSVEEARERLWEELNPADIVDTAGLWDSPDFVSELWQYMEYTGKEVAGFKTPAGAVILDPYNVQLDYRFEAEDSY